MLQYLFGYDRSDIRYDEEMQDELASQKISTTKTYFDGPEVYEDFDVNSNEKYRTSPRTDSAPQNQAGFYNPYERLTNPYEENRPDVVSRVVIDAPTKHRTEKNFKSQKHPTQSDMVFDHFLPSFSSSTYEVDYVDKDLVEPAQPIYNSKMNKSKTKNNNKARKQPLRKPLVPSLNKGNNKKRLDRNSGAVYPSTFINRSAPMAVGSTYRSSADSMEVTRLRKCEYIGDLRPNTANFDVRSFELNPGVNATFPWLSQIAGSWEYYKFNYLAIKYKPNCATSQAGTVSIVIDYDSYDSAPANKLDMSEYKPYVSGVPWSGDIYYVAPARMLNAHNNGKLFTRTTAYTSTMGDRNLMDVGVLYIATQDVSSTYLGELYIEYDVTLFNQQQSAPPDAAQLSGTINALVPFDSNQVVVAGSCASFNTSSIIQVNVTGRFLMLLSVTGATTLTAMSVTALGTGASATLLQAAVINSGATAGYVAYGITITVVDRNSLPRFTCVITGSAGAGTAMVRLASYPSSFL